MLCVPRDGGAEPRDEEAARGLWVYAHTLFFSSTPCHLIYFPVTCGCFDGTIRHVIRWLRKKNKLRAAIEIFKAAADIFHEIVSQ